jgi:hypothetical protein
VEKRSLIWNTLEEEGAVTGMELVFITPTTISTITLMNMHMEAETVTLAGVRVTVPPGHASVSAAILRFPIGLASLVPKKSVPSAASRWRVKRCWKNGKNSGHQTNSLHLNPVKLIKPDRYNFISIYVKIESRRFSARA